jgi:hypothetical protein
MHPHGLQPRGHGAADVAIADDAGGLAADFGDIELLPDAGGI